MRDGREFAILDAFDGNSDGLQFESAEQVLVKIDGQVHTIDRVDAVWWRQKPGPNVPADKASDLYDYYFVAKEWTHVHDYLGVALQHCYNVNTRSSSVRANNKLLQLKSAQNHGFTTPRTLVTNSFEAVQALIDSSHSKRVVFKTLTAYMNPTGLLTYTTVIDKKNIATRLRSMKVCPGIFQEYVDKEFELRITVVGKSVFAAKVNSLMFREEIIDWRQHIMEDIYEEYHLTSDFRARLLCLHNSFGLVFGAYDFVVRKDGVPVFLEVNPSGQWMWIENRLGFPIGQALASLLGDRRSSQNNEGDH